MPNNNGKNKKNSKVSNQTFGAATEKRGNEQKTAAKKSAKKKVYRAANSGKFEHLRKVLASFKKTRDEYIRIQNRKLAKEMERQNNEPKPETEIKNENNRVLEETKAKEEPRKHDNEAAKENYAESVNFETIEVDESELDDPALDEELAQLEQKMKREDELKANGIDPESVEEPGDPEFAQEFRELMQEKDERLEGAALEEAFKSLSIEVEGEIKDSVADDREIDDPDVDEDLNRLEREIKQEELKLAEQSEPVAEEGDLINTREEVNMIELTDGENITPAEFAIINNQANTNIEDSRLTASVKGQMRGILANSGVEMSKINESVDKIFNGCLFDKDDGISTYYRFISMDMSKPRPLSTIMDMMIKGVGNNLRLSLNESISNPADRMVAHQKLMDVLLKNYSPAAFSKGIDEKYLNNYFLEDNKNLEIYYRTYINKNASEADVEGFAKSVAEARLRIESSNIVVEAPEIEEQPKAEEQIHAEEQPKVEEQIHAEEQFKVEEQPQVELFDNDDFVVLTVGENITPAEFSNIYKKADKSVGNPRVTEFVKRQIREILADSGADNTNLDETVDKIFNNCLFDRDDGIASYYNHIKADMSASGKSRSSSSIMEMMIRGAGNNIRLALNGSFSDPAEQMIVHQMLLNVFLQNYSPTAFSNGIDEKYLNSYYLDDSKNLEAYYRAYINKNASEADVEAFAKSVSELRVKAEEAYRLKAEEENQMFEQHQSVQVQENGDGTLSVEDFYVKMDLRINDEKITDEVRTELTRLLKEMYHSDAEEPEHIEQIHSFMARTMFIDDSLGQNAYMSEVATAFFRSAYKVVKNENWNTKDKIRNAQRIADLMLKNYSPVAIADGALDPYADKFVVNNKEVLAEQLYQIVPAEMVDSLVNEIAPLSYDDPLALIDQRLRDEDLTKEVRAEFAGYLENMGHSHAKEPYVVGVFFEHVARSMFNFDPNQHNIEMYDIAAGFFREAYAIFNDEKWSLSEKVINAQRIADLMLENYSPIAFAGGAFDEFADNYVLKNTPLLLRTLHTLLPDDQVESVVQEINAFLAEQQAPQTNLEDIEVFEDKIEINEPENEVFSFDQSDPLNYASAYIDKQIENKENVEIKLDEITEIKEEEQKEPTLAEDFEFMRNNSTEPEVIKIAEDLPEKLIPDSIEENQANPEPAKLDTHALFQQIENNVLNPKTADNVVAEPKLKEVSKPVYSVPPIPGMRSNVKQKNTNDAPVLSKEEREARELADAKAQLERLKNIRTGTTEDRADRARMINYYQGIVDKHKSIDELLEESLELAEKARRENQERERRKQELKELENAAKNDIIEEKEIENELLEIGNEGEAHDSLRVDGFYDKLQLRMKDTNVTAQVRSELTDIVKEAGITDQEKAFDIVDSSYFEIKDAINSMYDPTVISEAKMSVDAPIFFYNAFLSLGNVGLSTKDRIITAQKFADVMIKNYSPVAFVDKTLDRFADNYTLNNLELLGEQLLNLGYNNLEVDKLVREISGVPENEQPEQDKAPNENVGPQPLHIPDFKQWLNGQIANVNIHQQVRTELTDIIKSAGVTDQDMLTRTVELSHKLLPRTITGSPLLDADNLEMPNIASQFFADSYNAIAWVELNTKDRVITAQKIANLMLKYYSPVAFKELQLEQYADNYVVNNRELLGLHLDAKGIERDKITTLTDEVQAALANVPQKEQPEPEANPVPQKKPEPPKQEQAQKQLINSEARVAVYTEKLKSYNNMYKLSIDGNDFASSVTEAWALMTSGDKQKMADGLKVMNTLFKGTLQKAFDVEKSAAYNEHRLPEYVEIIRSTNELLRSSMYGLTDMYHDPSRKNLFDQTAFGGLNSKDMGDLTAGESLWSKDQKSDEAWDIQSKEAKDIADGWLKENKPYEKMISEMKALISANEDKIVSRKEALDKLAAAEWLLINNEKMMVNDPEDPLNPMPDWGNRYWKALTEAREALGIDKHTSMRDLIQGDFAAMAKTVNSAYYNETQIQQYVLDKDVRELSDSMEYQKEQFTTQSRDAVIKESPNEKKDDKAQQIDENVTRWSITVSQEDERIKMKNEPKVFTNLVIEKANELKIDAARENTH